MPRRVAALLAPRPRLRLLLLAAAIVLVAISGAAALEAARNFHQLIELAQGQHRLAGVAGSARRDRVKRGPAPTQPVESPFHQGNRTNR